MLSILSTPIGNLTDLSERVINTLQEVEYIFAEDTRRTQQLLHHLGILSKKLISFHDQNEKKRLPQLLAYLHQEKACALVSDAGTPSISDPGYRLIKACREEKIPYIVLPGPCAVTTTLVASGLPPLPFYFGGFLPNTSGKRLREIEAARERGYTSLYFETPQRLIRTLEAFSQNHAAYPHEIIFIGRELTKKFEQYYSGSPIELLNQFKATPPRGEITLAYHPSPPQQATSFPPIPSDPTEQLRNLA